MNMIGTSVESDVNFQSLESAPCNPKDRCSVKKVFLKLSQNLQEKKKVSLKKKM